MTTEQASLSTPSVLGEDRAALRAAASAIFAAVADDDETTEDHENPHLASFTSFSAVTSISNVVKVAPAVSAQDQDATAADDAEQVTEDEVELETNTAAADDEANDLAAPTETTEPTEDVAAANVAIAPKSESEPKAEAVAEAAEPEVEATPAEAAPTAAAAPVLNMPEHELTDSAQLALWLINAYGPTIRSDIREFLEDVLNNNGVEDMLMLQDAASQIIMGEELAEQAIAEAEAAEAAANGEAAPAAPTGITVLKTGPEITKEMIAPVPALVGGFMVSVDDPDATCAQIALAVLKQYAPVMLVDERISFAETVLFDTEDIWGFQNAMSAIRLRAFAAEREATQAQEETVEEKKAPEVIVRKPRVFTSRLDPSERKPQPEVKPAATASATSAGGSADGTAKAGTVKRTRKLSLKKPAATTTTTTRKRSTKKIVEGDELKAAAFAALFGDGDDDAEK